MLLFVFFYSKIKEIINLKYITLKKYQKMWLSFKIHVINFLIKEKKFLKVFSLIIL